MEGLSMKWTEILSNVVDYIEDHTKGKLLVEDLAKEMYISASHLQRLFKLGTGQSLMEYARGRKLAHSLEQLYGHKLRIIDIAAEYGFEHEQSYIHAFRAEYGCTPGKARKDRRGLPVQEKLAVINVSDFGTIYGPELVVSPSLNIVGRSHYFANFEFERDALEPNRLAMEFVKDCAPGIPAVHSPPVFIGYGINHTKYNLEYITSVRVKNPARVPAGLVGRVIPSGLCARFIYMGEHSFEDINMVVAAKMYDAMLKFWKRQDRYRRADNTFYELIEPVMIDGKYCRMERYLPVFDNFTKHD